MKANTTIMTRRVLLGAVPALAAISWSAAAAAPNGLPGDDTELLDLGRQMEPIYRRFYELRPISQAFNAKFEERMEPWRKARFSGEITPERLCEVFEELRAAPDLAGWDDVSDQIDACTDATSDRSLRIMALPAHTIAGLAVKAKAAAFACKPLWNEPDDDAAEWDDLLTRKLIEAVLAMAGERLPWDMAQS